tara:strand:+ start:118 stop:507 length:390 start_codon:yes stop_codon:yes gene_type:complete
MAIMNKKNLTQDRNRTRKYVGGKGPRPIMWKSGPDPERHEQYRAWMLKKTQAKFRNEGWNLSFEEFVKIWKGRWFMKGKDGLWLTRVDNTKAWSVKNCKLTTRSNHFRHVLKNYKGLKYKNTERSKTNG